MTSPTIPMSPPTSATLDGDPLAGTGYRFVGRLGEGGMGEVVEAEHEALGHRVAVKLLRADYFLRFELRDRLRLEAQTSARIRHENLVAVTDFGETLDGRPFLVMERLHGRSLAEELRARGALPADEAADIARQALAGLAAAHAGLVLHRDLKPDNLFVCAGSNGKRIVKVLDFGVAKLLDVANPHGLSPLAQATAEGTVMGTPRYASPEQSRGERPIDARADVYAMGWILQAMLTGREPFAELRTATELIRAHATQMPPAPSTVASRPVPPALDAIVLRAVAKRPEERFADAAAFGAALDRFLERRRIEDASSRAPRPAPASTLVVLLLCAAVVLLGVSTAVALRLFGIL